MKRLTLLVVVLLVGSWAAVSQSAYVIVNSVRLPAESFVGDPVELRYTVRSQGIAVVPDEIPQPLWGEIIALRVARSTGEFDLRMTVTPYETGTLTLPRIDLEGIRMEGLTLIVNSVLPPGDLTLRPAHGPQRLPGTRAALLLVGLGVSVVIAFSVYFIGPGRSVIRTIVSRYGMRIPYRRLLACIQTLERDVRRHTMRDFYIVLVEELQRFMSSRIEENCTSATSTELIEILPRLEQSCGANAGTAAPLREVLMAADGAKFAKRAVRKKKRNRHLMIVRAVAVELESHRRRLRRSARLPVGQVHRVGA